LGCKQWRCSAQESQCLGASQFRGNWICWTPESRARIESWTRNSDQVGTELESGSRHLSSELIHGVRIIKIKVNSDNFNIKQKSNREVFSFKYILFGEMDQNPGLVSPKRKVAQFIQLRSFGEKIITSISSKHHLSFQIRTQIYIKINL